MLFWYLKKSPGGKSGEFFQKGESMELAIGICIGFTLGILIALCVLRKGATGNLVIIDDPEDGSYMFLEISKTEIEALRIQPTVKLNVIDKSKSHK